MSQGHMGKTISEAQRNAIVEETIYWIKSLPWWRRLFNKFEV